MHAQVLSSNFPPPQTPSLLFYPPLRPLHLHRPPHNFSFPSLLKTSSRASGLVEGKEIHGVAAKLCFDKDPFVQGLLFEEMRNSNLKPGEKDLSTTIMASGQA
ncbi:hypothetical protein DKX38_013128 [Salix brachista]|uniref:Uncharacterized protein n=1 Tax=Salix brachista TaxID=2182728 RepID=A0A5N5LSI9_9ROSI|nr:hypothetical protein DKX38_013128 [Salix brachista]